MKSDIILCGVGGQGILSIAACIGLAALEKKLYVKQAEVHGMSQRGGSVQSHLRISNRPIASDLIPGAGADMIFSVEPMEALRYLPYLGENGWLLTSAGTFENIPEYPALNDIKAEIRKIKNHIIVDANGIAKNTGSAKVSNIVMLGAGAAFTGIERKYFLTAIEKIFKRKGTEIVNMNLSAFHAGEEAAGKYEQLER